MICCAVALRLSNGFSVMNILPVLLPPELPVLPIALYLRVGLEGVGIDVYEEHFHELRVLHFQYYYVGLPALAGEHYVAGDNWLGVALAALVGWLASLPFRNA